MGNLGYDEFESFVRNVFTRIGGFREFPKYQLERRVDGFIAAFLPDILRVACEWTAEIVAPEFPLKNDKNNRSTNVDYLMFRSGGKDVGPGWLLVELKTDANSVDLNQLEIYRSARVSPMEKLRNDCMIICGVSREKSKYKHLVSRLDGYDLRLPIEIVYLLPCRARNMEDVHQIPLNVLGELPGTEYPEVWKRFFTAVLSNSK